MKKFLLLSLTLFVGMSTLFAQAERTVMVESFTNASCPPCAAQNPGFNDLMDANIADGKVVVLKYQTWWPGFDPFYEQNPDPVMNRVTYYGVTGVPNVQMDGVDLGTSGSVNQGDVDNAAAVPTPLEMTVSHTIAADLSSVDIEVTVTNVGADPFDVSDALLHIAVTEEQVIFPEPPGSTDEVDFKWVMRTMVPSANGTSVPVIAPGATETFTFDGEALPSYIYNYGGIGVVAFVQANASKEVYQAGVSDPLPLPGAFPDAALSSSTAGPSGYCDYELTPELTVTNADDDVEITSFDVSYIVNGGTPVTESWSGTLAPGASETVTFPVVTVDPGQTVVEYEISNINDGSQDYNTLNNQVASDVFNTLSDTPSGTDLMEGFEGVAPLTLAEGTIVDANGLDAFVINNTVVNGVNYPLGGFGNSQESFFFDFYSSVSGVSTLIFDKVDLSSATNAFMTFSHAYCQYQNENDQLEVLVSTDCGENWDVVFSAAGSALSTSPAQTARFWPNDSQWAENTVDLSAYDGEPEIIVGFRASSAYGNSLFVDDINITPVNNTIAVEEFQGDVSVFPNPASDYANVQFELAESSVVTIRVMDVSGKLVTVLADNNELPAGTHNVEWTNIPAEGMYFVHLITEQGETTQRLTVQR
jgi:hypothetical protein